MSKPKHVTYQAAKDLIDKYVNAGGDATTVEEGGLGLGTVLLTNNGLALKEFVIQEYFLNAWSSGHKVYSYNNGLPKKYLKMLERLE